MKDWLDKLKQLNPCGMTFRVATSEEIERSFDDLGITVDENMNIVPK